MYYIIISNNKPQIQSNFCPMILNHLKKVKNVFLFCFSRNCNNRRTCLSLESRPVAKSETKLASQLEFLAQRTRKRCLHFLHHSFPTNEAYLIREVHQHERSGTLWTVTGCKIMLYPSIDKSLEKMCQQERGFFPLLHTYTDVTKAAKRLLVWGQRWEEKKEKNHNTLTRLC